MLLVDRLPSATCLTHPRLPPPLSKQNTTGFGGDITSKGILDFVDSGRHLLLAGSSEASDTIRSLALECGVELDDKGTALYDHFAHQAAGGASDPTLVATSHIVHSKAIFGDHQPKVGGMCFFLGGGANPLGGQGLTQQLQPGDAVGSTASRGSRQNRVLSGVRVWVIWRGGHSSARQLTLIVQPTRQKAVTQPL
jgi:hypothetical protein